MKNTQKLENFGMETNIVEKTFRDSHAEFMFNRLNVFRKNNLMVDLTIVVEGREYGAHRVVMAAASESFVPHENSSSRVVLNNSNVTVRGFMPLLEFAYTSVLKVNVADITECFLAAVHLHMQSVSDFLRPYTNISNPVPTPPVQSYHDLLRLIFQCRSNNNDPSAVALLQLMHLQNMSKVIGKSGDEGDADSTEPNESKTTEINENDESQSIDTPKNDSGLSDRGSEEKEEEWKDLQRIYSINNESNNSNNNSTVTDVAKVSSPVTPTIWPPKSNVGALLVEPEEKGDYIPPPGAIVGRTRTGKPLTQPELPELPENGQYMSVRRRTLPTTVPKPHVCQICGSRFTRYHNLKQHIKLHSGVKPYECNICNKRFTRNYTLRLHKQKHGGGQQFQCGSCNFTGNNQNDFRVHLRMHNHQPTNSLQNGSQRREEEPARPYGIDPSMLTTSGIHLLAMMQQGMQQQTMQQHQLNTSQGSFQSSPRSSHNFSSSKSESEEMKIDEMGSENEGSGNDVDEHEDTTMVMNDSLVEPESQEVQVQ